MKADIITIDGPAGSGKGRIAKYISKKLGYFHIDSGILYRRIAYLLIKNSIDTNNKSKIKKYFSKINRISARSHTILRAEEISKISSKIAIFEVVRIFVNNQQKLIVKNNKNKKGFVIDGRDIGSVVFKKAKFKLYIEVNEKIRAERRYKQLIDIGEKSIYPKILKEIKLRDKKDKKRNISPLIIPKGAYVINNSNSFGKTIKQLKKIITIIK